MSSEEKSEYIFIWRIKNYSYHYQARGAYIDSPVFTVENLIGCEWNLSICPKGSIKLEKNEHFVSLFLEWRPIDDEITETPPTYFSLAILDLVGNELMSTKCENHVFSEKCKIWSCIRCIAIDQLATEMEGWEDDVLTLRFKIKCVKFRKQTIFGSEACTELGVERCLFEWDVIQPLLWEHSESVLFYIKNLFNFEITLSFVSDGLQFLIHLKDYQYDLSLPVMFKITLFDKKGCKITFKNARHEFSNAKAWRFPDFITENYLEACKLDSLRNEFKLMFEVYVSNKQILLNRIQKLHFKSLTAGFFAIAAPKVCSISAMQNDFQSLYINKKYVDVTIRVEKDEFPAHKLVLKARSPVFEAMFNQNMLESETGIINVTDIDGKTMKTFIDFLYNERVDKMDYKSAKKLLLAAHKYQVPSLVSECTSYLMSVLSVENACEILSIAHSVNCELLKNYAISFIISKADKIFIHPNWKMWIKENIELASDIFAKMSSVLISKH